MDRKFGIDIECVKLTPYLLNKDTIAFESTILIPLPEAEDFIIKAEKKENVQHSLTLSQEEYLKFYRELVERLKDKLPLYFSEPTPKNYYQIPTGIGGIHYEWGFHGRPRSFFGVELHFERSNKEFNIKILKRIEKLKSEIEKVTGGTVVFQKDWGKKWARIYIEKNEGKMTDELKIWAVKNMETFYKIIQPELDRFKNNI